MPDNQLSYRGLEFPLDKDAYTSFSAASLKELIRDRLNQVGFFTDQNYEGSNLSLINDVVALVFNYLIFYLNQTATNAQFSETQLYSSMNNIVKELGYNPIGHQTAILTFELSVKNLDRGLYRIPKYAYLRIGNINYSFVDDIVFKKETDQDLEFLSEISKNNLLYQGTWIEYPIKEAQGIDNERFLINVDQDTIIDHNNINVYVKHRDDNRWREYEETRNLFLKEACDEVFEKRFNENQRYEVKFGDGINGRKLQEGDQIAIYFLASDGQLGEIGANVLQSTTYTPFETSQYSQILDDLDLIDKANELPRRKDVLEFRNRNTSSFYNSPEDANEIRNNAPSLFRTQYRLVTQEDYKAFIDTNFSNILYDSYVMNNSEYLNSYIKYIHDLGIEKPYLTNRVLYNQAYFADSCNFNNVYVVAIPKNINNGNINYLNLSQKQLIIDRLRDEKVLTSETIVIDPIYIAFDVAVPQDSVLSLEDRNNTEIVIVKEDRSLRDNDSLIEEVLESIDSFFNPSNNQLGQFLNFNQLTTDIFSIKGIKSILTRNTINGNTVEGLSFLRWNNTYPNLDIQYANSNNQLDVFQFPYIFDSQNLINKIRVEDNNLDLIGIEY